MLRPLRPHTLLFAVYPVVFLYSRNMGEVAPSAIVVPVLVTLALGVALALALRRALGNPIKAAVVTSACLIMFYSYGHLFDLLNYWEVPARHRYVLPLWVAAWVPLLVWLWRTSRMLSRADRILNVAAGSALAATLVAMAVDWRSAQASQVVPPLDAVRMGSRDGVAVTSRPDIYYIVLDSYANEPILREMYGYDNRAFFEGLERRGFFVARESRSNYSITMPSTAATLNMDYLEQLTPLTGTRSRNGHVMCSLIENDRVERILRANGYDCIRINPPSRMFYIDFPSLLIRTTMLAYWDTFLSVHRKLGDLQRLFDARPTERPTFVYAHIMLPHDPYLFGPHGERKSLFEVNRAQFDKTLKKRGYLDQVEFVNSRVDSLVDLILARSKRPPIIILQADHGPRNEAPMDRPTTRSLREGAGILNAYYLPDGGNRDLYPSITPVNTFRLVFRNYFGLDYPPLPDRSFHNWPRHPFQFIPVEPAAAEKVQAAARP